MCNKRWIFVAAAVAISAAGLSSPTEAAILSVGVGQTTCADVSGGNIAPGTPVLAFDCHAAPNQQFEFFGLTVYTMGGQRCLDVVGGGTAPGTKVQSYSCNGTVAQWWTYANGAILYSHAGLCLDSGNMANGIQLVVNVCNASNSQFWQIK